MVGRRCDQCGALPSWGFVIEAGSRDSRRRRIVRRGFSTKAEASKAAVALSAEVVSDEYVAPSKTHFGRWLDDWLLSLQQRVKPSTLASYTSIVETHLRPSFGDVQIQAIHRAHLERYYDRLLASGVSTGTAKNVHAVLRKALADAVDRKLITSNPAADAFKLRVEREERAAWTEQELRAFLAEAKRHRLGPLMRVAAMTGMRRGEVLGLGWRGIDLHKRTVHVSRSLTKSSAGLAIVDPKSRRARRTIEIDEETARQLREWRSAQLEEAMTFGRVAWAAADVHSLVFTRQDGSPNDPDTVSRTVPRLAIAAGVTPLTFHCLRHTHATLLLKGGEPLHLVSRRLGHSSAAFTADRYSHVLPGQGEEAVARLSLAVD
jgi:integrase